MTDETDDIRPIADDDADTGVAGHPRRWLSTRHLELVVVVLLSATAILTAWAGFQSSKWSGSMSTSFSEAGAARTESVRASTAAGQVIAVDVALFTEYVDATAREETDLAEFYRQRFPEHLGVAVDAWEATNPLTDDSAPPSPFAMAEYVVEQTATSDARLADAEAASASAREANRHSDQYVVMTVLYAIVLFFLAVSAKLTRWTMQRATLIIAVVGLVGTTVVLTTLPIQL